MHMRLLHSRAHSYAYNVKSKCNGHAYATISSMLKSLVRISPRLFARGKETQNKKIKKEREKETERESSWVCVGDASSPHKLAPRGLRLARNCVLECLEQSVDRETKLPDSLSLSLFISLWPQSRSTETVQHIVSKETHADRAFVCCHSFLYEQ